jgi:hypothetical protein
MEILIFIVVVVIALLFLLFRGRAGSGSAGHVAGGERLDLHADESHLRAGNFPGPGGPIKGGGGGNVSGGG